MSEQSSHTLPLLPSLPYLLSSSSSSSHTLPLLPSLPHYLSSLLLFLLLTYPFSSPLSSTPPDILPSPSFPPPISPVSSSYMCTTLPDKWSLSQSQQDGDKAITNSYEFLSLPHQPRLGTLLNVEGKQVLCYCNIVTIELLEKEDRVWSRERE